MKLIFAGTPEFAVPALRALIAAGHEIALVLTQPDRPAGRGMQLTPSPVKTVALTQAIPVFQPQTLKDAEAQARVAAIEADAMIVAAYGLIIPQVVLGMPRFGCYNIHASLLPRWRGAAPIQRAILAGDLETGITIMEVVPALDAGGMIMKRAVAITEQDTAQSLHDALAEMGAELIVQAMHKLELEGRLPAEPQDEALVTYAAKLVKSEAALDWNKDAEDLSRQVRGFNPFPVAQASLSGKPCRIWMASALPGKAVPGVIADLKDGIAVGCGQGLLRIEELQMPGGKRMSARDFVAGHELKVGDRFDNGEILHGTA